MKFSCVLFVRVKYSHWRAFFSMISEFRGKNAFLSNFYLTDITYKGRTYKSVEHLYQAEKCLTNSEREKIRKAETPRIAKILGRRVQLRPHWDLDRITIMETILRLKFAKPTLKKLLRETGETELIENNYWHDTFWGVCKCDKHNHSGLNMLGKILMKIRAEMD